MFLDQRNYTEAIKKLCAEGQNIDLAVAFWGQGAAQQILAETTKKFRVICNLRSGGTNPAVIEALRAAEHVQVKHSDHLHAKLALSANSLIVGSANFSTNGLNIQDIEYAGWQEAGFLTHAADELAAAKKWFAKQWKSASEVTPEDMEAAKYAWLRRRKHRCIGPKTSAQSLLSMPQADLAERDLFVAVWQGAATQEGAQRSEQARQEAYAAIKTPGWTWYEDWNVKDFPQGRIMIDVYIGKRGAVRVDGPFEILGTERRKRQQAPDKGKNMTLCYGRRLDSLLDIPAKTALSGIAERVRQRGGALLGEGGEGKVIPIADFMAQIK